MSSNDPMPEWLTVKQVANRWHSNTAADENYVLACYGELRFHKRIDLTGKYEPYSRDDLMAQIKAESGYLEAFKFAEKLPEVEKIMLRVWRDDLLAFEACGKEKEAHDAPKSVKTQELSGLAQFGAVAALGILKLKEAELGAANFLENSPAANMLFDRVMELERNKKQVAITAIKAHAVPANHEIIMPIARQRAQEKCIINALKELQCVPLKLPVNKAGKPGIKAAVWSKVSPSKNVFSSKSVYETAWKRMKKNGEIADDVTV